MANNLKYKAASGKLLYNATSGKLVYQCATNYCVPCAAGTSHRQYQVTFNGGWTNISCPGGDCTTINGATISATNSFDCNWDGDSSPASCSGSSFVFALGIGSDGAGGLNIGLTCYFGFGHSVQFSFHQVGSTNCDGPWTLTTAGNDASGFCSCAAGSTVTVTHL